MTEPTRATQHASTPTRPASAPSAHDPAPAHPLADLHGTLGNLGVLDLLPGGGAIQTKLEVGAPDDEHEREADTIAASIMRAPEPSPAAILGDGPLVRRAPDDEKKRSSGAPTPTKKAPGPAPAKGPTPKAAPAKGPAAPAPAKAPVAPAPVKAPPTAPAKTATPAAKAPVAAPVADKAPAPAPAPAPAKAAPDAAKAPAGKPDAEHKAAAERRDDGMLAMKRDGGSTPPVTGAAQQAIRQAPGRGRPLGTSERAFYEPRLGHDLSGVRVHDDSSAHAAARDLGARAFTYGPDVFFGAGRHQPGTSAGRELMAHELVHTVQQRPGAKLDETAQRTPPNRVGSMIQRKVGDAQDGGNPDSPAAKNVTLDESAKVITFPALEVPAFRAALAAYKKELKRPPNYDRDEAETDKATGKHATQVELWEAALAGPLVAPVQKHLTALQAKPDDAGQYFLKSQPAGGVTRFYVGTAERIAAELTRPDWDPKGQGRVSKSGRRGFEVDHILELQLGGEHQPENMELLERSVNGASGRYIMRSIAKTVALYIETLPPKVVKEKGLATGRGENSWKKSGWTVRFGHGIDAGTGLTGIPKPVEPTPDDRWERKDIAAGKHLLPGVLTKAEPSDLGNAQNVKVLAADTGVQIAALDPTKGADGITFMKPFTATSVTYATGDGDVANPKLATIKGQLKGHKGLDDAPIELDVTRVPGQRFMGSVTPVSLAAQVGQVKAKKLSPIRIDDLGFGENGLSVRGQIIADVPIIQGTPIDFMLNGTELAVDVTLEAGDFHIPGPIDVLSSSMTISGSTSGALGVTGDVALEMKDVARGTISGSMASNDGLTLRGRLDFLSEAFKPAYVQLDYRAGVVTGAGLVTLKPGTVPGVKGGSLKASYEAGALDVTGDVAFDLPGLDTATVHLAQDPEHGTTLTAKPKLKPMPGIKGGDATVTLQEPAGGGPMKVSGSGTAQPDISGFDSTLAVEYIDGAFIAKAHTKFERGRVKAEVDFGSTNAQVDEAGRIVPGGPVGPVRVFGSGGATVTITPWLVGTAALRFLPNGEVEVFGQLEVPNVALVKGRDFSEPLVPEISAQIPIFTGLVASVGAGLNLNAGYDDITVGGSLGLTYNLAHPEAARLDGMVAFHAGAHAGLELYTSIGLGVGITGASITGDVRLGAQLGLRAPLDNQTHLTWSPSTGLTIENELRASLKPQLTVTLTGQVVGRLGPAHMVFWSRDLGKVSWGPSWSFGVAWPIRYEEGKPFEPTLRDLHLTPPDIKPLDTVRDIFADLGKEDKR